MAETKAIRPKPVRSVVLVEPRSAGMHIFSRFAIPRLGVVLLGTILRDLGLEVKVLVEECAPLDVAAMATADLVGISAITPTAERGYALADELRARGVPVVMGGPHPTHRVEEALEHCDYVVRGEGEVALPALVDALSRGGRALESVPSLSYRNKEGGIEHNAAAEPIRDLDALPDPNLGLVEGFRSSNMGGTRRLVPIQTSRGCPHDCSFCTVTTTFGRTMRYRSAERVVAEMLRHDLDRTHFFFYDDNFTANRRRTRELLEAFRGLPVRPSWSAQVRADVAKDEELLDEIAEAGGDMFYIGLESVNQESLKGSKKRQQLQDVSEHLDRIRSRGIEVHGMFVFGFDSDGPGTMERTVQFARDHDLFSVQLLILTPLPGSRWAEEAEAQGRVLHHEWSRYDTHHVCFRPARVSPAELQRWQFEGHSRFYTLRRALWAALRRDWARAAVTLYAAKINWDWKRRNYEYLAALREPSGVTPAPEPTLVPLLESSAPVLE